MKKYTKSNIIKALSLVLIMTSAFVALSSFKPNGEKIGIQWMSFEQALKASEKQKKKIFIDVYTDWCGWCKVMEAQTFSDKKISDYVNKKYYAVKLDAESAKTFSFKGQQVSERQLAQMLNVSAYPTTVYMDENFDLLSPIPGFLKVPELDKILKFYGEDAFKKQTWQDFDASYKPSN
jgi:thioredoxin-related protein